MSKKNINPHSITSIQAQYDDLSTALSNEVSFVEDDSKTTLEAGTTALKSVSKGIGSTVSQLNTFLNTVAITFQEADEQLSKQLDYKTHGPAPLRSNPYDASVR